MPKLALFACALLVAHSSAFSQADSAATPIKVQRFEYLWLASFSESTSLNTSRPLFQTDSTERRIRAAFARAIEHRFNSPAEGINMKMYAFFPDVQLPDPRAKARRKKMTWPALFLQVVHESTANKYDNQKEVTDRITVRYVIERTPEETNAGIVEKRFNIYRDSPPAGQIVLTSFTGMPHAFFNAIDSIALQAFDETVSSVNTDIHIQPACFFTNKPPVPPARETTIEYENGRFTHAAEPAFNLQAKASRSEKLKTNKNVGGNSAGGVLTLFTGIKTSKTRTTIYKAENVYADESGDYLLHFSYSETETTERSRTKYDDGSYSLERSSESTLTRQVDAAADHFIIYRGDTVCRFKIEMKPGEEKYTQFWDGKDTATIMDIPKPLSKSMPYLEAQVTGTLLNKAFEMKTSNGMQQRNFYIEGKPVVAFYGSDIPHTIKWYSDVSKQEIQLLTVAACIPLFYLNRSSTY